MTNKWWRSIMELIIVLLGIYQSVNEENHGSLWSDQWYSSSCKGNQVIIINLKSHLSWAMERRRRETLAGGCGWECWQGIHHHLPQIMQIYDGGFTFVKKLIHNNVLMIDLLYLWFFFTSNRDIIKSVGRCH